MLPKLSSGERISMHSSGGVRTICSLGASGAVRAVEVEHWLAGIQTANGTPASPNSKTKIRNIMCGLFSHAVRYEFGAKNPIKSVRPSAKRLRVPDILPGASSRALCSASI